jgi:hypothetical protein
MERVDEPRGGNRSKLSTVATQSRGREGDLTPRHCWFLPEPTEPGFRSTDLEGDSPRPEGTFDSLKQTFLVNLNHPTFRP